MTRSPAMSVQAIRPAELTDADRAGWDLLFARQPDPANPFLSPTWVMGWYAVCVAEPDQVLVLVRSGEELLGVAPMYRQVMSAVGVPLARRLVLVGSGHGTNPLELPQILHAEGAGRAVAREVVRFTLGEGARGLVRRVDWSEVTLGRSQAWFEPEWTYGTGARVAFQQHHNTRACVVLPLQQTWEQTRSGLKRNLRESLRRCRNRLARDGRPAAIHLRTGPDLDLAAVERLIRLHRQRADNDRAGFKHPDALAGEASQALFRSILPEAARLGQATLAELELGGQVVAAQLALHAPGCTYLHWSGFEPHAWDLSPVTTLQAALVEAAHEDGARWVNFSTGPNVSKLRWSEELAVYDDFAYGAGPRRLRWRYGLVAHARAQQRVRAAIAMSGNHAHGGSTVAAEPDGAAASPPPAPATHAVAALDLAIPASRPGVPITLEPSKAARPLPARAR